MFEKSLAKMAYHYKDYMSKSNDEARKNRENIEVRQAYNNWHAVILYLLFNALQNTVELTGLNIPNNSDLMVEANHPVGILSGKYFLFNYRGYRKHASEDAKKVEKILKREINMLAYFHNLPRFFVKVTYLDNRYVRFSVLFLDDAMAIRNLKLTHREDIII